MKIKVVLMISFILATSFLLYGAASKPSLWQRISAPFRRKEIQKFTIPLEDIQLLIVEIEKLFTKTIQLDYLLKQFFQIIPLDDDTIFSSEISLRTKNLYDPQKKWQFLLESVERPHVSLRGKRGLISKRPFSFYFTLSYYDPSSATYKEVGSIIITPFLKRWYINTHGGRDRIDKFFSSDSLHDLENL